MKDYVHPNRAPDVEHVRQPRRICLQADAQLAFQISGSEASSRFERLASDGIKRLPEAYLQPAVVAVGYRGQVVAYELPTALANAKLFRDEAALAWRLVRLESNSPNAERLLELINRAISLEVAADAFEKRVIQPLQAEIAELEADVLKHIDKHANVVVAAAEHFGKKLRRLVGNEETVAAPAEVTQ
jgi:DNA-binding Lrp family transcriptional regulator